MCWLCVISTLITLTESTRSEATQLKSERMHDSEYSSFAHVLQAVRLHPIPRYQPKRMTPSAQCLSEASRSGEANKFKH